MEAKKFRVAFSELSEKEKEWVRDVVLSPLKAELERQKTGYKPDDTVTAMEKAHILRVLGKKQQEDALTGFVLSSVDRHAIPKAKLPKELLPYIDEVRKARRGSLLVDGKGVVMASVGMVRALAEMTRPPWKTLPGEVQIVQGPRPALNKPLAHLLGRIKDSGFTHMHVDRKGNLVFEKKPELAGKIMAPSLKKPKTLFKRARVPF